MADTMKALVYRRPEKIDLEDVPIPRIIEPDDFLIYSQFIMNWNLGE